MEKSYETFVTDLRKLLLAAMDLKEEEIYFSNDGEKYGCLGDRLFVEYSCAMKSHFRKFGNQMSGSGNHLCNYASLLA